MAAVAQGEASVIPLRSRRAPIAVSPAMVEAGRAAFVRYRRDLSDLFDAYPCDMDLFVKRIYRAMAAKES